MEWYEFLRDKLNLDAIMIGMVLLTGFFQEKYLTGFKLSKDGRTDASYKTLLLSLLISSLYIFLNYKEALKASEDGKALIPWVKYLISFFAATSLYDMAIRPFRKWLKKKTGDTDPEPVSLPNDEANRKAVLMGDADTGGTNPPPDKPRG